MFPRRGHPLSKTACLREAFPYSALNPLHSLATAIRQYQPHLLIPNDDRAVGHLHELYAAGPEAFGEDFRGLIQRSLGSPASYSIISSRLPVMEIARQEGIRAPDTIAVNTLDDLQSLFQRQAPPWVLKADGTWGGHGVAIARDPDQARRRFLELVESVSKVRALKRLMVDREAFSLRPSRQGRPTVVAQEFIAGRPANSAVFCWEGNVLAAVHVVVLHAQGETGAATVVRVVDHPEMASAAQKLARRLGLSGFFGLDFVMDPSGQAHLIELNPRGTPLCHLQLGEGKDMVAAVRAQLTSEPIQATSPVTSFQTITYFPQAWHWDHTLPGRVAGFHDVPWEDPTLTRELMRLPWPDRGLLARIYSRLRRTTFADRARRGGGEFETEPDTPGPEESKGQAAGLQSESKSNGRIHFSSVVPLQRQGTKDPLFLVHAVDGSVSFYHYLTRRLEPDRPVYAVLSEALLGNKNVGTSVEQIAEHYIREIRALHPDGLYHLLGYSFGGFIVYEIARCLRAQGARLGLVGLIDNRPMTPVQESSSTGSGSENAPRPSTLAAHLSRSLTREGLDYVAAKLRARSFRAAYTLLEAMHQPIPVFLQRPYDVNWFAGVRYRPQAFPGRVTLFEARDAKPEELPRNEQWRQLAEEGVEVREVPGDHVSLLFEPQVEFLAREITDCLSKVEAEASRTFESSAF